ncbi:LysM peptidoglycan-binding domain-containing protein [Gymnodinialimonas sp. 2305UL16-5]|uniref:LysM peptidoglycan-binding domain-containing protein n=1 Tax=Gymnodinialimonas mytili TaxID=3126503 RepID=UPI003098998A
MSFKTRFGSGGPAVALAAVAGLAVIGAAVAVVTLGSGGEDPVAIGPAPGGTEDANLTVPQSEDPVADADPAPEAPRLDVVRIAPDGAAVIAGQSPTTLSLDILLDGEFLAEAIPDRNGDFVALATVLPSDRPRSLTIIGRGPGGLEVSGAETVLVAPFGGRAEDAFAAAEDVLEPTPDAEAEASLALPAPDPDQIAPPGDETPPPDAIASGQVATDPATEVAPVAEPEIADATAPDPGEPLSSDAADLPAEAPAAPASGMADNTGTETPDNVAAAPAESDAAPDTGPTAQVPQAPTLVIAGPDGVRVTQGGAQPQAQTQLLLDAISYNVEGDVILAGRGPAQADLRISLNNLPIQLGEVGPDGAWSLELPDVDPGTYTLSVAELGADGREASRVETPFLREDPERIAAAPEQAAAQGVDVITVQPGFTLWGIADQTFGEGLLYVQIFEENQDQISDPNWIFPGQIFRLPDLSQTAEDN